MADYFYDYLWGSGPRQVFGSGVVWSLGQPGYSTGYVDFQGTEQSGVITAVAGTAVQYGFNSSYPVFGPSTAIVGVGLVLTLKADLPGDALVSAQVLYDGNPIAWLATPLTIPVGENDLVVLGGPNDLMGRTWVYADRQRVTFRAVARSGGGDIHRFGINGAYMRYYGPNPGNTGGPPSVLRNRLRVYGTDALRTL